MKPKSAAEIVRISLIETLASKNQIVNLYALTADLSEDDIELIKINLELYKAKYPGCGLRIDTNTSQIYKSKNIGKIASYINSLSAEKFEKFSALLVKIFGFEITYATKASHDQGIDFIGVKKFQVFDSRRKSYLIGQAKKYNVLVDVNEVRGFAGAVMLLRSREFSQTTAAYKDLPMRSFTPVEGIFATSYFFSTYAQRLCDNSDIISLDFIDLVLLTEKAIIEKTIEIESNNVFIKTKADLALSKIEIIK